MECPNCGSPSVSRYCAECGQATPSEDDYSLRAHVADFFEHLTSLGLRWKITQMRTFSINQLR